MLVSSSFIVDGNGNGTGRGIDIGIGVCCCWVVTTPVCVSVAVGRGDVVARGVIVGGIMELAISSPDGFRVSDEISCGKGGIAAVCVEGGTGIFCCC